MGSENTGGAARHAAPKSETSTADATKEAVEQRAMEAARRLLTTPKKERRAEAPRPLSQQKSNKDRNRDDNAGNVNSDCGDDL